MVTIQRLAKQIRLSPAIHDIWQRLCPELSDDERQHFLSMACKGLQGYINAMADECQALHDKSIASNLTIWLEPLVKFTELVSPIVNLAGTATGTPLPTDLVLGGIRGVLNITKTIPEVQKRAIQFLSRIGEKANLLSLYAWTLQRNEYSVQKALIMVYSDIALFCRDVRRLFGRRKKNAIGNFFEKTKVSITNEFSADFESHVRKFEDDFETFQQTIVSVHFMKTQQILDAYERRLKEDEDPQRMQQQYQRQLEQLRQEKRLLEQEKQAQMQRKNRRQLLDDCMSWLSPLKLSSDFSSEFKVRCEATLDGTGEWFLKSDKYHTWKSTHQSDLLWVKGNPGSGKSILSAITISDIFNNRESSVGVAYAFCQRKQQSKQTFAAIIGAMARQLLETRNDVSQKILDKFAAVKDDKAIEDEDALNVLGHAMEMFDKVYLVIDAVDEFSDPERLLRKLLKKTNEMLERSGQVPVLKLLVLSRGIDQVGEILESKYDPICPEKENQEDIKRYIEYKLPGDKFTRARALCVTKAQGMFLWVRLLFQRSSTRLGSSIDMEKIINSLPGDLDGIYDQIFCDLSSQLTPLRDKAWLVLLWILDGYRPLMVNEMQEAIGDYEEAKRVEEITKIDAEQHIVELCKNLIYIDKDGCFSLIHESVRSYLDKVDPGSDTLKKFQTFRKGSEDRLASICLNYLQLQDFDDEIPASFNDLGALVQRCSFVPYAAKFWGCHAALGDPNLHRTAILSHIRSTTRRELTLQIVVHELSLSEDIWSYSDTTSELHCLALFDLPSIGLALYDEVGALTYSVDGNGQTPLAYAIKCGRESMVLWLLTLIQSFDESINYHSYNSYPKDMSAAVATASCCAWGGVLKKLKEIDDNLINASVGDLQHTPIIIACLAENEQAVIQLMELGADPSAQAKDGYTALIAAASSNMARIIDRLLKYESVNVNTQDDKGYTALHFAAANNKHTIVEALLRKGADPTIISHQERRTPVHDAALENAAPALRKIIKAHPDFDLKMTCESGWNPLHLAACKNAFKAVEALIDLGCSLNEVDDSGRTALHIAAEFNALETVSLLLEARCDTSKVNDQGNTALHLAAKSGYEPIIGSFLRHSTSADLDILLHTANNSKSTVLHLACMTGCTKSVEELIRAGANTMIGGFWDASPLHYAASYGHPELAAIILRKSKDPNPRDKHGSTPLHFAAEQGHSEFISKLLKSCNELALTLEVSAKNLTNKTALFLAAKNGDAATIDILLPLTSTETFQDETSDDNRLIHLAAWWGNEALMEKVINPESIKARGYKSRTPLLCAITSDQTDMVKHLIPLSKSCLDDPDEDGWTALLLTLRTNKIDIANDLLDANASVHATTSKGTGALHSAALSGNAEIFRRLLEKGCRSYGPNEDGETPFHLVALRGSMDMVEALESHNFNDFSSPDHTGSYADHHAAKMGRLGMLQKLKEMNITVGLPDKAGFSAAHVASMNGHLQALDYLREQEVDIFKLSNDGTTPFLLAAYYGYPQIITYFLSLRPQIISESRPGDGENAFISTAAMCRFETLKLLTEHSPEQFTQIDAFGNTMFDVSPHLKKTSGGVQIVTEDTKNKMQLRVIQESLRKITIPQLIISKQEARDFIVDVVKLARALRIHGDAELAKLCELYYYFGEESLRFAPYCDGCACSEMKDSLFVCKSCYITCHLCSDCHDLYIKNGRTAPKALTDLIDLEENIRNVRKTCEPIEDIRDVHIATHYFGDGSQYIATKLTLYEQWEQVHNPEKRYDSLQRPGQIWLKLIEEFAEFVQYCDPKQTDVNIKKLTDFQWRYDILRRSHRPDKECTVFRCKDHEYMEATSKEYEELKMSGIFFDTQTGRITEKLIRHISEKYGGPEASTGSTVQMNGIAQVGPIPKESSSTLLVSIATNSEGSSQITSEIDGILPGLSEQQPVLVAPVPGLVRRRTRLTDINSKTDVAPNGSREESSILSENTINEDSFTTIQPHDTEDHLVATNSSSYSEPGASNKSAVRNLIDFAERQDEFVSESQPVSRKLTLENIIQSSTAADHPIDAINPAAKDLLHLPHEPQASLTTEPETIEEAVPGNVVANPPSQETSKAIIPLHEASQHHEELHRLRIQRARDRERTRLLLMWEDLKNNEKTEAEKIALENALIVTNAMQKNFLERYIRTAHATLLRSAAMAQRLVANTASQNEDLYSSS